MTGEKISVALPPELAASVRNAVDSGDYPTMEEVVRDALWAWHYKRNGAAQNIAKFREMIAEGHASGYAPFESPGEILAEIRARAEAERQ
jgi:antitoxin ParD1/3/4